MWLNLLMNDAILNNNNDFRDGYRIKYKGIKIENILIFMMIMVLITLISFFIFTKIKNI